MDEEVREVDVRLMLDETIVDENDKLLELPIGSNERKQVIEAFEKFYKLRIEEGKAADEYYNNQERRIMEKELQEKRLDMELQMHKDKMQLENERLEMEKNAHERELELKEAQIKADKTKSWMDLGKASVAIIAWIAMSMKVMKFEETGSIRSKAFTGTLPKLKFW